MRAAVHRFAARRVVFCSDVRHLHQLTIRADCSARHVHSLTRPHPQLLPFNICLYPSRRLHETLASNETPLVDSPEEEEEEESAAVDGMSSSSSNVKRKRGVPAFYAVRLGHEPGIYYSWDDTKAQTVGYKGAIYKKFNSLAEAEDFMKKDTQSPPKTGKPKYYGVQVGHMPGVYIDYPSALEQVTGFKGGKQKSFATQEEAQAYVYEIKQDPYSDSTTPISLKRPLDSTTPPVTESRKPSKKQKKSDGSAVVPETNGHFEPGTGPLPLDSEDGFDATLKLPLDRADGLLEYRSVEEQNARKMQPTGDFNGPLKIWTDGAAKGNGQIGAIAGYGVWFGRGDTRNEAKALASDSKQTNQRAELTAISRAIDIAPLDRDAHIYTDSYYSIKCLTEWFQKWESNEWKNAAGKPVENKDIIEPAIARIRERELARAKTKFEWVKGHDKNVGNIEADRLANEGARLALQQRRTGGSAAVQPAVEEYIEVDDELDLLYDGFIV